VSRAEEPAQELRVPDAPRLIGALRDAAIDFYFNSWRLVPANIAWGIGLVCVALAGLAWPPAFLLLTPLLCLPTVGLFRLGALICRDEPVALSDSFAAWRRYARPALAAGTAITLCALVFGGNLLLGLTSGTALGYGFATIALWSLLLLASISLVYWPLLVDPERASLTARQRIRLTAYLVLGFPLRFGALTLVLAVLVAISVIFFAALLTITIAYCAVVASRYVLPAADRFEGRMTKVVPT
jgi:hypothetical protein